jgi:hypothetical protein
MGKFTQNQWSILAFGTTLSLFLITMSFSLFAIYLASGGAKLSALALNYILNCALVAFALGFVGLLVMIILAVASPTKKPEDAVDKTYPKTEKKIVLDFTEMTPKQITAFQLKDMSPAQIEALFGKAKLEGQNERAKGRTRETAKG